MEKDEDKNAPVIAFLSLIRVLFSRPELQYPIVISMKNNPRRDSSPTIRP